MTISLLENAATLAATEDDLWETVPDVCRWQPEQFTPEGYDTLIKIGRVR